MSSNLSPVDFIQQDCYQHQSFHYFQSETSLSTFDDHFSFRRYTSENPIQHDVKYKIQYNPTLCLNKESDQVFEYFKSFFPVSDFYHMNQDSKDILFPGVRYFTPGVVVFERPPSYQHISVSYDSRDDIDDETNFKEYYIPVPWQVYIASYNPQTMRLIDVRMFFANNSMQSPDDSLYAPPIFNFYSNGKLCRPFYGDMEDVEKYAQTISGVISSAYDSIWNSGYNLDITENISHFIYTKKYSQFEQYQTENTSKHFSFLNNNPLSSLPNRLPNQYSHSFYKSWESIPLEHISTIKWSPYSEADFFYQEQVNTSNLSTYIDQYCADNGLVVHEYEDDHYDEDGDSYCPDNCISEEDLLSSFSFRSFVNSLPSYTGPPDKSIHTALSQVITEQARYKLGQEPLTTSAFNKTFLDSFSRMAISS